MIIPINLHPEPSPSSSSTCTFPPALAQFGSEGLVLIELQGSLEVEGDNIGQTVGKLSVETSTVGCSSRYLTGIEVNRMFTEETHFTDRTPSTGRQTRESAETPCCSSSFITRTWNGGYLRWYWPRVNPDITKKLGRCRSGEEKDGLRKTANANGRQSGWNHKCRGW